MDLQKQTRRQFLATAGGVAVVLPGWGPLLRIGDGGTSLGGMNKRAGHDEDSRPTSDLERASAWIARLRQQQIDVLVSPVSRLQREFRLGYGRACSLAQRLEQYGEWTIFADHAGRSAHIHPFPPQF